MTPDSPRAALAGAVLSIQPPPEAVLQLVRGIQADTVAQSRYLANVNFVRIHPDDLEFLFHAYDTRFLTGLCRRALNGQTLDFRLSRRMTSAGGKTTRVRFRTGEVRYEIAISVTLLFESFKPDSRPISVCGLECASRMDALQRLMEHEMVHLIEQICWEDSECAAPRFQDIARRLFLHREHTHALVTRRERAAESGIRVGSLVSFEFEGRMLTGRVNRITQRATVLVEDPDGLLFSDGARYKTYYVPIAMLAAR